MYSGSSEWLLLLELGSSDFGGCREDYSKGGSSSDYHPWRNPTLLWEGVLFSNRQPGRTCQDVLLGESLRGFQVRNGLHALVFELTCLVELFEQA